MATQNQNHTGERRMAFRPVESSNEILPDAQAGQYEATIEEVKVAATQKDQYPMLIVNFKLTSADDDENSTSVGATVSDFLVWMPDSEGRRGNMGKIKRLALADKLGIDRDSVPTNVTDESDFDDFISAIKGESLTLWVTHNVDKQSGEIRCNVDYNPPKSLGGLKSAVDDDEDSKKPLKGKPQAAKPQAGKARR